MAKVASNRCAGMTKFLTFLIFFINLFISCVILSIIEILVQTKKHFSHNLICWSFFIIGEMIISIIVIYGIIKNKPRFVKIGFYYLCFHAVHKAFITIVSISVSNQEKHNFMAQSIQIEPTSFFFFHLLSWDYKDFDKIFVFCSIFIVITLSLAYVVNRCIDDLRKLDDDIRSDAAFQIYYSGAKEDNEEFVYFHKRPVASKPSAMYM